MKHAYAAEPVDRGLSARSVDLPEDDPALPVDTRGRPTLGVVAVIAALVVMTAVLWPTVHSNSARPTPFAIPAWMLLVMFGVAEIFVLHVQVRREAKTISLSEIALVLGLFYATTPAMVVARV